SALVLDVAEEVSVIAASKEIDVVCSVDEGIPFEGNERRLREAIMNIAGNAVKYMGNGTRREIRFTLTRTSDALVLTVADTGVGIAPDAVAQVFDRFYRAERAYGEAAGTGLGLAITKKIIDQAGGTVAVESTLGKGSVFTITLPVSRSQTPLP